MADPHEILEAIDQAEQFVMIPRLVMKTLGPRDAAALCWIQYRTRNSPWVEATVAELADDIGLSEDQMRRALSVLGSAQYGGRLVASEPVADRFSRKRRYRLDRSGVIAASTSAESRGLDAAESRDLPLSLEAVEVVKEEDTAADAALVAFDAFWERYPKSRRRERATCLKLWRKSAKGAAGTTMVNLGLNRWLAYWRDAGTEERFITTSIVWLRNRRWEDDPTIAKPSLGSRLHKLGHYAPGSPLMQGATDRSGESGEW